MRPYLRAANVTWSGVDVTDVKSMNFTDAEVVTYRLEPGDILLSEASGSAKEVGKPAKWTGQLAGDVCFQNTLLRVRAEPGIVSDYLHFRLLHECLSGGFVKTSRGVGIHHLGAAKLAALTVEVPPAAEQRRIAAVIAERLGSVDVAHKSLRRIDRLLRTLRHRVLMDAVTPDPTGSSQPGAWTPHSLGDVALAVKNGTFVSRPGSEPSGVPILRIGAVRPLALNLDDRRWTGLKPEDSAVAGFELRQDDLLFTRYNGNPDFVGACAVVPPLTETLVYPDKLIRVRLDPAKANPAFVAMACSVGVTRAAIARNIKTTSGQTGISGRDLRAVQLSLPSLPEQEARAEAATAVLANLHRLGQQVVNMERRLSALRLSLLASASAGSLVEQDPSEEPASVMLERIAAARKLAKAADKKVASSTVRGARKTTKQESNA